MGSKDLDSAAERRARYRLMRLSRRFEETVHEQFDEGNVPGPLHLSIGQEAVAVGGCWPLRERRRDRLHPPRPPPLPGQGRPRRPDDGRAARPRRRLLARSRRLDAHRDPGDRPARHQRHRRRRHPDRDRRRAGAADRRARRTSASASSARARPPTACSAKRSTPPASGSCRSSSSARTTATSS